MNFPANASTKFGQMNMAIKTYKEKSFTTSYVAFLLAESVKIMCLSGGLKHPIRFYQNINVTITAKGAQLCYIRL